MHNSIYVFTFFFISIHLSHYISTYILINQDTSTDIDIYIYVYIIFYLYRKKDDENGNNPWPNTPLRYRHLNNFVYICVYAYIFV
jgi:hypothetical protein